MDIGQYLHEKVNNTMKRRGKYIMRLKRVVETKISPKGIFNRVMKGALCYALENGLTRQYVIQQTSNFCGNENSRVMNEQDSEEEGSLNYSSEESDEEDGLSDDELRQDTPSQKKTSTCINENTAGKTPEGDTLLTI